MPRWIPFTPLAGPDGELDETVPSFFDIEQARYWDFPSPNWYRWKEFIYRTADGRWLWTLTDAAGIQRREPGRDWGELFAEITVTKVSERCADARFAPPDALLDDIQSRRGAVMPGAQSAAATPARATEGEQAPEALVRKTRKRRRKGDARLVLAAQLQSLADKGQWGETDVAIIRLACISRDTFYRLTGEDGPLGGMLADYRRETLGRGPSRPDDY
jgi:hypothetical protein